MVGKELIAVPRTITPQQAHRQYVEQLGAYRALIPDPTPRMEVARHADAYFRTQALGVWQADNASSLSPGHVEYYHAIYSPPNPSPAALYWEVASGVANYGLFAPPPFFEKLRQYDRMKGTSLARSFIDQLTLMMLLFAAVIVRCPNGFNCGEDHVVVGCIRLLEDSDYTEWILLVRVTALGKSV